jgi:putative addiction module component (TIGR02574 family)
VYDILDYLASGMTEQQILQDFPDLEAADIRACLRGRATGYTADMNRRGLDIASMTSQERLSLLDALWDSLAATPEAIPLTEAQCTELDRRLDDLEVEGPVGIPWEEVLNSPRIASAGWSPAEFAVGAGEAGRRPAGGRRRHRGCLSQWCGRRATYPTIPPE